MKNEFFLSDVRSLSPDNSTRLTELSQVGHSFFASTPPPANQISSVAYPSGYRLPYNYQTSFKDNYVAKFQTKSEQDTTPRISVHEYLKRHPSGCIIQEQSSNKSQQFETKDNKLVIENKKQDFNNGDRLNFSNVLAKISYKKGSNDNNTTFNNTKSNINSHLSSHAQSLHNSGQKRDTSPSNISTYSRNGNISSCMSESKAYLDAMKALQERILQLERQLQAKRDRINTDSESGQSDREMQDTYEKMIARLNTEVEQSRQSLKLEKTKNQMLQTNVLQLQSLHHNNQQLQQQYQQSTMNIRRLPQDQDQDIITHRSTENYTNNNNTNTTKNHSYQQDQFSEAAASKGNRYQTEELEQIIAKNMNEMNELLMQSKKILIENDNHKKTNQELLEINERIKRENEQLKNDQAQQNTKIASIQRELEAAKQVEIVFREQLQQQKEQIQFQKDQFQQYDRQLQEYKDQLQKNKDCISHLESSNRIQSECLSTSNIQIEEYKKDVSLQKQIIGQLKQQQQQVAQIQQFHQQQAYMKGQHIPQQQSIQYQYQKLSKTSSPALQSPTQQELQQVRLQNSLKYHKLLHSNSSNTRGLQSSKICQQESSFQSSSQQQQQQQQQYQGSQQQGDNQDFEFCRPFQLVTEPESDLLNFDDLQYSHQFSKNSPGYNSKEMSATQQSQNRQNYHYNQAGKDTESSIVVDPSPFLVPQAQIVRVTPSNNVSFRGLSHDECHTKGQMKQDKIESAQIRNQNCKVQQNNKNNQDGFLKIEGDEYSNMRKQQTNVKQSKINGGDEQQQDINKENESDTIILSSKMQQNRKILEDNQSNSEETVVIELTREAVETENEIIQLNTRYEKLLAESKIEKNSMRKCEMRKEIFAISDRLKTFQERAYVLKKKEKAFLLPLTS